MGFAEITLLVLGAVVFLYVLYFVIRAAVKSALREHAGEVEDKTHRPTQYRRDGSAG